MSPRAYDIWFKCHVCFVSIVSAVWFYLLNYGWPL